MSNPMLPEKLEESSSSRSSSRKRSERKIWKKKPIKISRLPSFGFSSSDFTIDQIPTIFSGYAAESEDSSSSDMSDDSRNFSKSSDEEIDQERSRSVKRLSNLKSMKVLMRQSTRKFSGGGAQRLKKMRSMKRLTSNSRHLLKKKNLDSIPRYLRPTSSSASKNVEKIQNNLGGGGGVTAIRLKRMSSLRYNGLLKPTSSSAMKGSKKSNDVCNYRYCSLHGTLHSHGGDDDNVSVTVPSLKRFLSMRRKFLKRQKSVNRRLVLLKRTLSRKRVRIVSDQESKQDVVEDDGDDSESNGRSWETETGDVDDGNGDGGIDSMEIVASPRKQWVKESGGMELMEVVASPRKQWVKEPKLEIMDVSDGRIEPDLKENAAERRAICEDTVMGLDHDDRKVEGTKSEENVEDSGEGSSGQIQEEDGKKTENVWNDKESTPEIMDDSEGSIEKTAKESNMTDLDYDNGKVDGAKSKETVEDSEEACREEDGKSTENIWNDTVTLVKQAFDEILMEITDDDVGADSSDSASSDMKPIKGRDTNLTVIVSTSHIESENERGAKKWSYLKRVILLKRFLKSLNRREKKRLKLYGEESEKIMKLRRELVGEKKNAEEWMLDHALRQVISTLAPSQKRKVKHLVKAFESLIPMDCGNNDLQSPGREENGTVNSQTISRDIKETDLEETKLTIEALEPKSDASLSHDLALEEELGETVSAPLVSHTILRDDRDTTDLVKVLPGKDLEETKLTSEASDEAFESNADASSSHDFVVEEKLDETVSGSSKEEKEEKGGDSENQNLSTWRNLIQKHMVVTRDNSERKRDETEEDVAAVKWFQQAFETILSEIPDDEEVVSKSSKEEKEEGQGETKSSWNSLRKVIVLKRFVSSLEKVRVFNLKKSLNLLPGESELEKENVLLIHRSTMDRRRRDGEELMLDYALIQAISRLAPIQRKKVGLLVQAFDTVLDGHETSKQFKNRKNDKEANKDEQRIANVFPRFQVHRNDLKEEEKEVDSMPKEDKTGEEGTLRVEEDCEVNKDEQRIQHVFSRFQVNQKDLKEEEKEVDSTPYKDETGKEGIPRVEEGCEVNKDEQRIKNVFSRFQVHQKDMKGEEEVDSKPRESSNLPPSITNVKQRIVVEKEKDSRLWKLIYKHMVTEKEEGTESVDSVESECDDEANARRSGTVILVREALEKILSEIPDNSSDDQSVDSDITTDQELYERNSQVIFKPKSNEKRVKGWNNVKKVILLKRFVSDLGSLNKLSPKTPPRFLPWEPDPETEKIRLRHQEIGGKRNSEEWMLDYALRQAISTLAPSQKRKVSLLAQAFDTISLQDVGSCSSRNISRQSSLQDVGSFSRDISRQSSISSTTVHSENEGNAANAEIIRGKLRNLQEDLKETTKSDGVAYDVEEKQQCSSLWRLLCKQMEDNERNQTQILPEETKEEEEEEENEVKEEEKMELYQTEAVELLGEVIDGISLEESQKQNQEEIRKKINTTLPVSQVKINRWGNLKRVILLRKFVKALDNVRKFNPREPRFLPLDPEVEAEKVNLRHQETQNKRNGEEWMVDNALQEVVSKLTPARKLKVQLLVQAFESISATGN